MAHSLSSKKRIRQNEKRRLLNRTRTSQLRGKLRRCADVFVHGTAQDAETAVREACQHLDRAAGQGTLHRNAAARRKSRLTRRLNTLRQKAAPAANPASPA